MSEPPRKLRLTSENRAFCCKVGVYFNGQPRPMDVYAYDADAGWIETRDGRRIHGAVEPYWRSSVTSTAFAEPQQSEEAAQALLDKAAAKRARKAEKLARLHGENRG